MHVTNNTLDTGLMSKTAATPLVVDSRRNRRPAAIPVTVQESDSGAQVIHIVEYVPPAYDPTRPHSGAVTNTTVRPSAAAVTVAGTETVVDDPTKPGGMRPLPSTPF
ncbi:uncharacterized protein LOC62_06G007903 [Vanrija pseudolonga]|uniref:Uncharacterized protein n=1 Tax=Vanrija pseudolonga TaxID=143232 RepID=A0AAF0YCV1_9TREE|nr:hypothetical protein LOC62_06G007903 [Vanrija pseudolonga]